MAGSEPSIGEVVAGFVEGAIVGVARAVSEFGSGAGRRGLILESDDLIVRRVTDHTGQDLEQALDLLEKEDRITPDERRSRDDMIRFVRESNERGWFRHRTFRDHLLIARSPEHVEAMAFLTHYARDRQSLISYFVARRGSPRKRNLNRATLAMARALATFHASLRPRVRLLVAEVDDPRLTTSPPERNRRCSRIKIFKNLADIQGKRLRIVEFPYIQPSMDPFDIQRERQMLLIFVPLQSEKPDESMNREDLGGLLTWLYGRVYSDAYLTNPQLDAPYRAYLARLQRQQLQGLPDTTLCPDAESWLPVWGRVRTRSS
jgi:hypothetical protein